MMSSELIFLDVMVCQDPENIDDFSESQIEAFKSMGIAIQDDVYVELVVNPKSIGGMYRHKDKTYIYLNGECFTVKQTLLEILEKIDETKDRKIRAKKFRRQARSITAEFERYSERKRNRNK